MNIPEDEYWIPTSVTFTMGEPIVSVVRTKRHLLGFVSDVDIVKEGRPMKVPLEDIRIDTRKVGFDAIIFHLPRSGSTAVAKAAAKLDNTRCFFEPRALNDFLSPQYATYNTNNEHLKKLLALFLGGQLNKTTRTVIKLSSWSTLHISRYRHVLKTTPFFFVCRDPVQVLVQILERPTGWMEKPVRKALQREVMLDGNSQVLQYTAAMLKLFIKEVLTLEWKPTIIEHKTLREDTLKTFRTELDPEPTNLELEKMAAEFDFDSEKWDRQRLYIDDSTALSSVADTEIKKISSNILQPLFAELLHSHP